MFIWFLQINNGLDSSSKIQFYSSLHVHLHVNSPRKLTNNIVRFYGIAIRSRRGEDATRNPRNKVLIATARIREARSRLPVRKETVDCLIFLRPTFGDFVLAISTTTEEAALIGARCFVANSFRPFAVFRRNAVWGEAAFELRFRRRGCHKKQFVFIREDFDKQERRRNLL